MRRPRNSPNFLIHLFLATTASLPSPHPTFSFPLSHCPVVISILASGVSLPRKRCSKFLFFFWLKEVPCNENAHIYHILVWPSIQFFLMRLSRNLWTPARDLESSINELGVLFLLYLDKPMWLRTSSIFAFIVLFFFVAHLFFSTIHCLPSRFS